MLPLPPHSPEFAWAWMTWRRQRRAAARRDHEKGQTFVSVASFSMKPLHAKTTVTDLESESLNQIEIGVRPDSVPLRHLELWKSLLTDGKPVAASEIYG